MANVEDTIALIDAAGLGMRHGVRWALRDATFSVRPGEVVGIIGPNGAGKTTLLDALAGLTHPSAGSVRAGSPMFYVPDGIHPWADQTAQWVLRFIADVYGATGESVASIAQSLSLEQFLAARMGTLSKGEHRRVMIALGLIATTPVLLLDEPFDGLDLRQVRLATDVLRAHAKRGRTIVLAIHQLGDAARVCDRLVMLSAGCIVADGTLDELRMRARLPGASVDEVFLALT
jgi:ABC-2 type transport system ATP-binding protein